MRVVLIATGYRKDMEPLVLHRPTPMMRIIDKPLIVHIIEFLVKNKLTQIDIVVNHLPNIIEKEISDGSRWGASVTYHLACDNEKPYSTLCPVIKGWKPETILLALGDLLPHFDTDWLKNCADEESKVFMLTNYMWSGWAILPSSVFCGMDDEDEHHKILDYLGNKTKYEKVDVHLSAQNLSEYVNSNIRFIENPSEAGLLPTTTHEIEPGIWVSRGVAMRPGIVVKAPIYIGQNCQIMENCEVGPNAIIENNCIIGRNTVISDSIISQNSYVGEHLTIRDSIVDKNLLVNMVHNTAIEIRDDFILSELSNPNLFSYPLHLVERVLGGLLFICFLPLILLLLVTCRIQKTPVLLLEGTDSQGQLKSFNWLKFVPRKRLVYTRFEYFFCDLPALINVLRGEVHFVGVSPKKIADVENLPPDWRKLYMSAKVGLVTLAAITGQEDQQEHLYAAEAYYSKNMGFFYDLKLFFKGIFKKVFFFTRLNKQI